MTSNAPGRLSVSKGLLGALAGGIVVCLVVIGFLLGRQWAPRVEVVALPAQGNDSRPAEGAEPVTEGDLPVGGSDPAPAELASPLPPSAGATPAPSVPGADAAAGAPSSAESAAVGRYFSELDRITAPLRGGADPTAAAREILAQATGGNSAAFDDLVNAQQGALEALRGLDAPDPCRAHHTRLVAVSVRAGDLLRQTRSAIARLDMSAVQTVAAQGEALQKELREIDVLGQELRRRYGS